MHLVGFIIRKFDDILSATQKVSLVFLLRKSMSHTFIAKYTVTSFI